MDTPDTFMSLFYGYSVIWLLLAFFVYRLMKEQSRTKTELEELRNTIKKFSD